MLQLIDLTPFRHEVWFIAFLATGFTLLRIVAHAGMDLFADTQFAKFRTTYKGAGPTDEQRKRESEWPPSFLLVWFEVFVVAAFVIGPETSIFTWESLGWTLFCHAFMVEPVYYLFHVVAHDPRVYRAMHQWHHLSVEATAWTSVTFKVPEHLIYDTMFAIPPVVPALFGKSSYCTVLLYQFFFDCVNAFGHTNFEIFPPSFVDSWLFRLFYCPSFHRVHHTHFRFNYALFMPWLDMLFGTYNREATTENMRRVQEGTKISYKFLSHPILLDSCVHMQGSLANQPPLQSYSIWQKLLGFCIYMPYVPLMFFPINLPWALLNPREYLNCKVKTGSITGAVHFVPCLAFKYFLPVYKQLIVRYQCLEIMRSQRDHPELKAVGLGCFNKMQSLNKGGEDLVKKCGKQLRVKIVHGNTMTAAVCAHSVVQELDTHSLPRTVFLTGCTSKVGRAVALYLNNVGVHVVMMSSSRERVERIVSEASNPHLMEYTNSLERGRDVACWINGTMASDAVFNNLPDRAHVVNFSVPSGFELQDGSKFAARGITVTEGACFRSTHSKSDFIMNQSQFLPHGTFYACHVGTIVHAGEEWDFHEVGDVNLKMMNTCFEKSEKYGFTPYRMSCFKASAGPVELPGNPQDEMDMPSEISLEELAAHSTEESCWVAINGSVYNLSSFLDEHPGGKSAILMKAGQDATLVFEPLHPPGTLELYAPEKVGELPADVAAALVHVPAKVKVGKTA
jgi:sterol desaturase/sphingolipid hydroxylase (fatty acid hydroxylase superfamily)/cytochrome b involved in lipid metabolism